MAPAQLSLDNEIFRVYLMYALLLSLKMLAMSAMVSFCRVTKKVFENPEDSKSRSKLSSPEPYKYVRKDPTIERIRRCHQNDLENIPLFLIVGLLFVLTGPTVFSATWHFRVFAAARSAHTFVYLTAMPQPSRVICMYIASSSTISMAVQGLMVGQF